MVWNADDEKKFKCDYRLMLTVIGKCCYLWFESLAESRTLVVLELGQRQMSDFDYHVFNEQPLHS